MVFSSPQLLRVAEMGSAPPRLDSPIAQVRRSNALDSAPSTCD